MILTSRWLFRLFYLIGLFVILISSFSIVQEINRRPLGQVSPLEQIYDMEKWEKWLERDHLICISRWEYMPSGDIVAEIEKRSKKYQIEADVEALEVNRIWREATFAFREWKFLLVPWYLGLVSFLLAAGACLYKLGKKGREMEEYRETGHVRSRSGLCRFFLNFLQAPFWALGIYALGVSMIYTPVKDFYSIISDSCYLYDNAVREDEKISRNDRWRGILLEKPDDVENWREEDRNRYITGYLFVERLMRQKTMRNSALTLLENVRRDQLFHSRMFLFHQVYAIVFVLLMFGAIGYYGRRIGRVPASLPASIFSGSGTQ